MWAHYAGNHTGFVLGYDKDSFPLSEDTILRKVDYRNELLFAPLVIAKQILSSETSAGIAYTEECKYLLYQKLEQWKYEEEWRIIRFIYTHYDKVKADTMYYSGQGDSINIKPEVIYFGANMKEEHRKSLAQTAEENVIQIHNMKISINGLECT